MIGSADLTGSILRQALAALFATFTGMPMVSRCRSGRFESWRCLEERSSIGSRTSRKARDTRELSAIRAWRLPGKAVVELLGLRPRRLKEAIWRWFLDLSALDQE